MGLCYAFQKGLEICPGAGHPESCSDLLSWSLLPSFAQGSQHRSECDEMAWAQFGRGQWLR